MEGVELVRLGERLLKLMSDSDIKVTDYKYISLYDKYKEMRKEHYKYWYAIKVLSEEYNSGMCVSREDLRMSAVFIGRTDSRSQFWNTISHELTHVGTAIIDYYAVPYSSEAAAYLQGYLLQRVVEEIATPCR